jgi:thioredoxin reductase
MQLGPIANWGLNLDKKTIEVDTEKFETNQKGIYAVGDICNYPGKLKLILSGFHEGALAARACFKLARPNEKYRFEFTTSSKTIKVNLIHRRDEFRAAQATVDKVKELSNAGKINLIVNSQLKTVNGNGKL